MRPGPATTLSTVGTVAAVVGLGIGAMYLPLFFASVREHHAAEVQRDVGARAAARVAAAHERLHTALGTYRMPRGWRATREVQGVDRNPWVERLYRASTRPPQTSDAAARVLRTAGYTAVRVLTPRQRGDDRDRDGVWLVTATKGNVSARVDVSVGTPEPGGAPIPRGSAVSFALAEAPR
jgi:hypothetical protein